MSEQVYPAIKTVYPHLGAGPKVCARCGGEASEANRAFIPLCETCLCKASVADEQRAARQQEEARLDAETRRIARIMEPLATIPSHYRGVRFDMADLGRRIRRADAILEARSAAEERVAMITLIGGAGSGKTTLASAILHLFVERALEGAPEFIKLVRSARWIAAPSLARARRTYKLGDGEAPLVEDAIEASLVVLDDLGMERDDGEGAISDVLYERHAHDAPTVITTNLRYADLCQRYGTGIARRVAEAGVTAVIKCGASAGAVST